MALIERKKVILNIDRKSNQISIQRVVQRIIKQIDNSDNHVSNSLSDLRYHSQFAEKKTEAPRERQ